MNEQGVYLDKWIIDLLPIDEKAFRVAVFLVCNVGTDGKTRTTYAEIARGTGMTYENARGAIERMYNSQSLSQAIPNHFPITRQSHGLCFDINIKGNGNDGQFPITSQSLPNHSPITFPKSDEAPTTAPCDLISTKQEVSVNIINNSVSTPKNSKPTNTNLEKEITPLSLPNGSECTPLQEKSPLIGEKGEAEQSAGAPKTKRFVKPTIEEVQAYCAERNSTVDPISFWNFYESKGWVVGKSPMKNWHSAIATWERKDKQEMASKPGTIEQYNRGSEIARKLQSGELNVFSLIGNNHT